MLALLKFWREGIIAILILWLLAMAWNGSLVKKDLATEKAERKGIETALAMQSAMIDTNRAEYETNLERAKVQKERVRTEYKTRTEVIYQWRENNATCDDAMRFVNDYHF